MKRESHGGSLLLSAVFHVAFGAFLLWVLSIPAPFEQWLMPKRVVPPLGEQLSFFRVPNGGANSTVHAGGNGRPPRGAPSAPQTLVAPTTIPSPLPATKLGAPAVQEAGTGPVISAGGAGPGIMPQLHDPRIWIPPGAVVFTPLPDNAAILDTNVMHKSLAHLKDSLLKRQADALSTVFEAGGKKYGVDAQNIYIADFKIPAALLGLLPIRPTGYATPEQAYHTRQSAEMNYQAGRALDAEDFHTAVKRIRQRKEREHELKLYAEGKGPAPAPIAPETHEHHEIRQDPIALQSP